MSLLNTVSISKASIPGHELTDEEKANRSRQMDKRFLQ